MPSPTPWPGVNARLLSSHAGLPIAPLQRLAHFSADDFERFTLEWAEGYLKDHLAGAFEVQQRGGAGDKGRDIVVWLDPPTASPRRSQIYQCKHYTTRLGAGAAAGEIAKLLHYTCLGDFPKPETYWFVTHLGVTGHLQDLIDIPDKLRQFILDEWDKHCAKAITGKGSVVLAGPFKAYVESFDFATFRIKQPHELIDEHGKTKYHHIIFGAPLITRPPVSPPPSTVAPLETAYVGQLFEVIGQELKIPVSQPNDFAHDSTCRVLFNRSRLTFYAAEGLKALARDHMADQGYFTTLLEEFSQGLFFNYSAAGASGYERLVDTIKAAQALQLGGHILADHVQAADREGMCHQMANEDLVRWCKP
ncbi:ABC-three component system protein [Caulobacter hibisci]|uniref:ABC-three component system protein n=1 Tax=Caulobacter hibisci TaxID=2035993 RepID=UPI0018E3AC88|nr:ABC-three component system protein [Caulobacter hibisci]